MLKVPRILLVTLAAVLLEAAVFAQAPTIGAGGIVNGASFTASLSPGTFAAIFGQNLSMSTIQAATTPWPTTLGGAQVSVGGKSAALSFASPTELNIQIPVDVAPGSVQVTVTVPGKGSASATVTLASYSPGIFTQDGSQHGPGLIQHGKDSSNVTAQSPAQPGETLVVYAVGLGPTNPAVATGAASPGTPSPATTTAQPTVSVGGQQASVSFSGLTPGQVSLYQVSFTLPTSAPGGNLPVTLSIGGQTSDTVTLTVASLVTIGVVANAVWGTSLSPGSWAEISGQNLATSSISVNTTPWPTILGGAQVSVGGKSAALSVAMPGQLTIQIPFDVVPGSAQLIVTVQGKGSALVMVTLAAYSPAIFTSSLPGSTQSGSFFHLPGTSLVTAQSPAQPGETLVMYAVGLGPTNPTVATGAVPSAFAATTMQPTVSVGDQQATVISSGLGPGNAGLYQVNFTLPASAPNGNLPVTLSIGGQTSNTVTLPVAGPAIPVVNAVVNGSFSSPDAVAAPGTIVTIWGSNFGSKDNLFAFPATDFQGISVTFNGVAGPLFAVAASGGQINVLVPTELPESGTVPVQVKNPAGPSASFTLKMSAATPGIFRVADPSKASRENGAVLFANTAWLVMPASMATALKLTGCTGLPVAATCGQPAGTGDYIQIFITGLGRATPGGDPNGKVLPTGSVAPANGSVLYQTVQTPIVTIGGVSTPVLFSGIAPGFAGEYQINIQVPGGVTPGDDVPVVVSMPNGASDSVTIAVHP
jgi:uncharacterized protein (TIGR03437 family)